MPLAPDAAPHPRLAAMMDLARRRKPLRVGVVFPCDKNSLAAALEARDNGFIEPVLVGPGAVIRAVATAAGLDLAGLDLVEAADELASARRAVALAGQGEFAALMKGSLHTDELLGAVVGRESPLRTGRRTSHAFWFDSPNYHKPFLLTDAVVNIAPGLPEKVDIVRNVIGLAHGLGLSEPKIAILSAVETVNAALPSTIDAAALCKMAERGQIDGAIIDGPLAFDNAISTASAATKKIKSRVAGDPDILVAPTLEAGNILYKSLVYMGGAACAGLVLGARIPVILTSRADSTQTRVASCALAALTAASASPLSA